MAAGRYFSDAGIFLIDLVFSIYMFLVLLRFLLQAVRADFHNPFVRFIVTATNPPVLLLRKIIPGMWGYDLASVALLIILAVAKTYLIGFVIGIVAKPLGVLVVAIGETLQLTVNLYIVMILVRVIVSWFITAYNYPSIVQLLVRLTDPIMQPLRRWIPAIGGLDISPIAAFAILMLINILVCRPIIDSGWLLAR